MRTRLRIDFADRDHAHCSMWVNGGLVVDPGRLTLRLPELVDFILLIKPDAIVADREQVSDALIDRLRGFREFELA